MPDSFRQENNDSCRRVLPDTKTNDKKLQRQAPFKAGRPVPRRKFQPVNVIVWTRHFARAGEGAWLRSSCILKSLWRN